MIDILWIVIFLFLGICLGFFVTGIFAGKRIVALEASVQFYQNKSEELTERVQGMMARRKPGPRSKKEKEEAL